MSKMNLTYSSELMENRLQAELIAPQKKFEALQTRDGHSLLFSIGTDDVLYLTRDASGATAAGWSRTDLSSALIAKDFADDAGATCRTFEAGQSARDQSIGMAMVVRAGGDDHLYLSLGNSNRDVSWADAPNWTVCPFDATGPKPSALNIVNVFFCETTQNVQYIVVDIVRDPSSAVRHVQRFYIDPTKAEGTAWVRHDLPIDVEADRYDSCVGRLPNDYYDGVYTAGRAGQSGQLEFRPLVNAFGDAPPSPIRLELPGGAAADAIASVRRKDLSSDLLAVAGTSLCLFAAPDQKDGATAKVVAQGGVFSGTRTLAAVIENDVVPVWGVNGSDEVYYTRCPLTRLDDPAAWSTVVPVLSGIERMSPCVNRIDDSNTIFAAGGGRLSKITQNTRSKAKLWQTEPITLPAPPTQASVSFKSYTTTIKLTDEQDMPLCKAQVSLSANRRGAVYINGLYHVLDETPVHVASDMMGTITIVEATEGLSGTIFTLSAGGGAPLTINPAETPFKKLAALDTPDKLKAATIAGGKDGPRKLVSADVSEQDLKAAAAGLANLGNSFDALNTGKPVPTALLATTAAAPRAAGPIDALEVAAGDLFNWLKTGVDAVIHVVEEAAGKVWHVVVTFAGQVYRAVLDTVDAVVAAAEWVFKAVKTALKDVIAFVEYLFDWDDIRRTKDVLHNLTKCFLNKQVDDIDTLRHQFDKMIAEAERVINKWAGITDWSGLGPVAGKPAIASGHNPMKNQNAASQHLVHHYKNNARAMTFKGDVPEPSLLEKLVDDLIDALRGEAAVLDGVLQQLVKLSREFATLTVEDILKRLVGILADVVLSSIQVIGDALLKILADVARSLVKVLDTKIHIPVLSDILNEIGVPDFSLLDLFTWIAAVVYTVPYKIVHGTAPFADNSATQLLITADSMDDLQRGFDADPRGSVGAAAVRLPGEVQVAVFIAGHAIGGFCALMQNFLQSFEAAEETPDNSFGIPSAVLGIIGGAAVGASNYLVPRCPIQNQAVGLMSSATTVIRIVSKIMFSGAMQKRFAKSSGFTSKLAVPNGRATGAVVDAVLVIPGVLWTAWHLGELIETPESKARTDAILGECSNIASYINRLAYFWAVNDPEPDSKAVAVGVLVVANLGVGGLQTAEAMVVEVEK